MNISYIVDGEDPVQTFLASVFDREAEKAVLKAWKKVYTDVAQDELADRGVAVPEPRVSVERGNTDTVCSGCCDAEEMDDLRDEASTFCPDPVD